MSTTFIQDPNAFLDYKFDWAPATNGNGGTDWLSASELIAAACIVADSGMRISNSSITDTNTSVTYWASASVIGTTYKVTCRIQTNSSPARIDDRTMQIRIEPR